MRSLKKNIPVIGLIISLVFMATSVLADSDNDKTLSPYFFIENGDPAIDRFPLKSTKATVSISGVIADVTILQRYENNGKRPLNAQYIFPASTRAAVHGMKMKIGERIIRAKVMERVAAQNEFNQAKKQGKSASLLKQQRPNVFSMNVANILPGDTIEIELHYTELLVPTDNTYEFVYPTVVGPRYSGQPEAKALETERWVKNPYLKEGSAISTEFNIEVYLSTGIPLQEVVCHSHETKTVWKSESTAKILLIDAEKYSGNRDFILNYRLAGKTIQSGLMLYQGEDEKFFLLMAQPPERVKAADIPAREYIFVVDVSGSMHGFPINTAKELLKNLIGDLKTTDKFNVVFFAGSSTAMSPTSLPATKENIDQAIRVINQQRGGGGTELYSALKRSIALPRDEKVSRTILIITDGYIAAEKEVFHLIQENLNQMNVFAFGIGSSVNRYLIEGISKAGLGEPFIVTEPLAAKKVAKKFQEYISSPVLTHITVQYKGIETYDVEPPSIPDLFAERPLIIFGKWRGACQGTIELKGISGEGNYVQTFHVEDTQANEMNHTLRYLWARTRIGRLSDFNFNRNNPENKEQITTLGLTYNLLTAYTSFIAVHEVVRNPDANTQDVKQPLPLPKGVSNLAVGKPCSKVPEPEFYVVLVISVMVLVITFGRRSILRVMNKTAKIYRKNDGKI